MGIVDIRWTTVVINKRPQPGAVKTFIIYLLSALLLVGCSTKPTPYPVNDELDNRETITVVMDNNYPPYTFLDKNGNLQGILIDRWKLWEERTGKKAIITGMDWSDALSRMEAGEFDVIDTIFQTESRAKIYEFSDPYETIDVPIFFRKNISGITNDVSTLKGYPIAAKAQDAVVEYLSQKGVGNIITYPSYEAIVEAASKQEVIVFSVDKPAADYFLHQYNIQNQFDVTKPLYSGQFHRAVLKGNTAILSMVEEGFNTIADSEYQVIDEKWLGSPNTENQYLLYAGVISAGLLFILLVLIFWNRSLQENVKRKTKVLQESEQKFRQIFETAGVGITIVDGDGKFITGNPAIFNILGFTPDEYSQRTISSITHPDDLDKNERLYKELWSGKIDRFTVEKRNRHKDGHYVWGQLTTSVVKDANNNPLFSIGLFEDISERKRSEYIRECIYKISQATNTASTLSELYQSIHAILSEIMMVNNFYIALYDKSNNQLHFPFFTDEVDKEAPSIELGRGLTAYVIRTRQPLHTTEDIFDQLVKSGDVELIGTKPVEWLGVPLIVNDEAIGVMATQSYSPNTHFKSKDVELMSFISNQVALAIQKKSAEEALSRSDEEQRALFAAMPDLVIVLDKTGRYTKIVPTNVELLIRPTEDLLGKRLHEVFSKEDADRFLGFISNALSSVEKVSFEYSLPIQSRITWFSAVLSPISEDSVIWVARDITARKEAEEAQKISEARYRNLFEESPISLWEEDFSGVKRIINELKENGVSDFNAYFHEHPEVVTACSKQIRVTDVNRAAIKLVHGKNKEEVIERIREILPKHTQEEFIQELVNIASGLTEFDRETTNNTLDKEMIIVNLRWSVVVGYEDTLSKVIVSLVDITKKKQAEAELDARSRIEELLMQISTGFINVKSEDVDEEIHASLKQIGQFAGVDHAFVFQFNPHERMDIITHEWLDPKYVKQFIPMEKIQLTDMPWFVSELQNNPILINDVSQIPADLANHEKEMLIERDIQSMAIFPMVINQQIIGIVGFSTIGKKHVWQKNDILLMQEYTNILSNTFERTRLLDELEDRAIKDELTGVLNRRGFAELASNELNRSLRYMHPLGLILFDVDHLKSINDTYGHAAGDMAIKEVVKCCQATIRGIDILGRWGGDEFIILLPETDVNATMIAANRLQQSIDKHDFLLDERPVKLSISAGVATSNGHIKTIDELFSNADTALYAAKAAGKNCVKRYNQT